MDLTKCMDGSSWFQASHVTARPPAEMIMRRGPLFQKRTNYSKRNRPEVGVNELPNLRIKIFSRRYK